MMQYKRNGMFERYRIIHFVGIGGIGMSGIAELLHNLGYEVTGSDLKRSDTTERLQTLGMRISIGHSSDNIDDPHVVVKSSAVSDTNPEVAEAKRRNIPVIPRAEMLAELARLKYGVLVAGAHGKTTTTSLVSSILARGGLDPTVVIGGKLKATASNAQLGHGDFIVAEADESDGSFLKLSPAIAVVTNIDKEHMDFFKTLESLKQAFLSFMNKVPFYGTSIVCIENEHIRELLPFIHRRLITYGLSHEAELRAENINKGFMSVDFDVFLKETQIGHFYIPLPGIHNALNSLAAIGVGLTLNIDVQHIRDALGKFAGIQRRCEFKGEMNGIAVYDDYGHHPAEIKATLRAMKESLLSRTGSGRVCVLFQPHRYTRTRDLIDEFARSFSDADELVVIDIYPAGEPVLEGVHSEILCQKIREEGVQAVLYMKDRQQVAQYFQTHLKPGDIFLSLGAGDVWKEGERILEKLMQKEGPVNVGDK